MGITQKSNVDKIAASVRATFKRAKNSSEMDFSELCHCTHNNKQALTGFESAFTRTYAHVFALIHRRYVYTLVSVDNI